ncbi:hypothetical protein T484DRAFT_1821364, partial [Baffinella frigidus]
EHCLVKSQQDASARAEKAKAKENAKLAALEKSKRESEKAAQDRLAKSEQAASAREEKAKAETNAKLAAAKQAMQDRDDAASSRMEKAKAEANAKKAKAEANAKFAALEKAKQEGEQAASALREKTKAEGLKTLAALEKAKQEGEQAASALREKTKAEGLKTLAALEKAKQDSEKAAQDRLVKSENAAAAREDVSHSETRSALERVKKTQAYVDHLEGDITTAFTIKTDIPQDQIADPDRRRQLQAQMAKEIVRSLGVADTRAQMAKEIVRSLGVADTRAQMAKEIVRSLGVADTRVETIGSHADAKGVCFDVYFLPKDTHPVCFDVYFLPKDTHPSEPAATLLSRDLKLMLSRGLKRMVILQPAIHTAGFEGIFGL